MNRTRCEFCNKEILWYLSLCSHEKRCKKNPDRVEFNYRTGEFSEERKKKISEAIRGKSLSEEHKRKISQSNIGKSHNQTEETRKKISQTAKKNKKSGGIRKGAGRGKHGYYKNFYCDSQWELAFVIYCLDNNIAIERNRKSFQYLWNNENHKYFPDFKINSTLVEIKSFHSQKTEEKIKAVNEKIIVLYKEDLKPVFEYIEKVYNKDIEHIYELYE